MPHCSMYFARNIKMCERPSNFAKEARVAWHQDNSPDVRLLMRGPSITWMTSLNHHVICLIDHTADAGGGKFESTIVESVENM